MSVDNRTMSIITFVVPTIVSAITTAITIGFLLGGTDKTIQSISQNQINQSQEIKNLTAGFITLDKNQAIMSNEIQNISNRMNESTRSLGQLNDDMRCIRFVVSSKGDINKC